MPWRTIAPCLVLTMLIACGGGGGAAQITPPPPPPPSMSKVTGSVLGLRGSGLVLQMGSGETLPIPSDGTFAFPTALAAGTLYDVKVTTQPRSPVQTCNVQNASGTVAGVDITNVQVSCETMNFSVGGNVTGLAGPGLTLNIQGTTSNGGAFHVG